MAAHKNAIFWIFRSLFTNLVACLIKLACSFSFEIKQTFKDGLSHLMWFYSLQWPKRAVMICLTAMTQVESRVLEAEKWAIWQSFYHHDEEPVASLGGLEQGRASLPQFIMVMVVVSKTSGANVAKWLRCEAPCYHSQIMIYLSLTCRIFVHQIPSCLCQRSHSPDKSIDMIPVFWGWCSIGGRVGIIPIGVASFFMTYLSC